MGKKPFTPPSDAIVQKAFTPPGDAVVEEKQFTPPADAEVTEPNMTDLENEYGHNYVGKTAGVIGQTVYNFAANTVPQMARQSFETLRAAANPSNPEEFVSQNEVMFRDYVKNKEPELQGIGGFFTPFDMEKYVPKYSKQFVNEMFPEAAKRMEENLPERIQERLATEKYIQQKKKESALDMRGIPQSITDIKNPGDVVKYGTRWAAEGLMQLPLAVVTRGASSYVMEAAEVYDQQVDQGSQALGISREEYIRRNLDKPAAGQLYAVGAAALDAVDAAALVKVARDGGASLLKKSIMAASEAVTEPVQGTLEEAGGRPKDVGLWESIKKSWTDNFIKRIDESAGGFIGGVSVNAIVSSADTGNEPLNKTIDDEAKLLKPNTNETEVRIGPEVQATNGQNQQGAGNQEPGSSGSINRTEEIRGQENGSVVAPQEEGGGGTVLQTNALQEQGPGSEVSLPGEGGENQTLGGEGIRPGQQGQETTLQGGQAEEIKPGDKVFVYGTLENKSIREKVFGKDVPTAPATARGNVTEGEGFKDFHPEGSHVVPGEVITLTPEQLQQAKNWEADYNLKKITLSSGEQVWTFEEKSKAEAAHEKEKAYQEKYKSLREKLQTQVEGFHQDWLNGNTDQASVDLIKAQNELDALDNLHEQHQAKLAEEKAAQEKAGKPYNEVQGATPVEPVTKSLAATKQYKEQKQIVDDLQKKVDKWSKLRGVVGEKMRDSLAKARLQLTEAQAKLKTIENETQREQVEREEKKAKETTVNAGTALEEQMKRHANIVKTEGIKKGQSMVNHLLENITDIAKQFKFSPKQLQAIIKKIQKVNFFSPGQPGKVNQFLDKISRDAEYAEKLDTAETLRQQVLNRVKSPNRDSKEKALAKIFKQIDPSEVDNIDDYIKLADQLKTGLAAYNTVPKLSQAYSDLNKLVAAQYESTLGRKPGADLTTEQMLDEMDQAREEDLMNERIQKLAEDEGITFNEAKNILSGEKETTKEKQEKIRKELVEEAKDKKITAQPTDPFHKKVVDIINKIDPTNLSIKELQHLIRVIERINVNDSYSGATALVGTGLAQQGWNKIKENATKFKVMNLNWLEKGGESLPLLIHTLFGLPKVASDFQLYSGIHDVANMQATAMDMRSRLIHMLNEMEHKQSSEGFTEESRRLQGLYKTLIGTSENIDETEDFLNNKSHIERMIQVLNENGKGKDAEELEKMYDPFRAAKTVDDAKRIMNKIDPQGKKVMDAIIDHIAAAKISEKDPRTLLEATRDDNEMSENKETVQLRNYGGPRKWIPIGSKTKTAPPGQVQGQTTKPQAIASGHERIRGYKEDSIIDLANPHLDAANYMEKATYAITSKPFMEQVREFAKQKDELRKLFGVKEYKKEDRGKLTDAEKKARDENDALTVRADELIKVMFGGDQSMYHQFENAALGLGEKENGLWARTIKGIAGTASRIGYMVNLSGIAQILKQSAVLANAGVLTGWDARVSKSMKEVLQNPDEAAEFYHGKTVSTRKGAKTQFGAHDVIRRSGLHDAKTRLLARVVSGYTRSKVSGVLSWMGGLAPLLTSDQKAALATYLSFYKQSLKDSGEKYEGFAAENKRSDETARREADAYAKHMVDILQGVSSQAEQAAIFRHDAMASSLARTVLVPYGHFSTNQKGRNLANFKALALGNVQQKKEALKMLGGTMAEIATFQGVSQASRLGLMYFAGTLAAKVLGLPDRDDWEEVLKKTKRLVAREMLYSILPMVFTSPGETAITGWLNDAFFALEKMDDPELTRKEFDKDHAPLPVEGQYAKHIFDYMGAMGAPASIAFNSWQYAQKGTDENLTKGQSALALIAALGEMARLGGVMPADLGNALRSTYFYQMKVAKEEAKNTTPPRNGLPALGGTNLESNRRSLPPLQGGAGTMQRKQLPALGR